MIFCALASSGTGAGAEAQEKNSKERHANIKNPIIRIRLLCM
jgi:hypothetical protein